METKVPFYNIVNVLLPGLVLIGSCILLFFGEIRNYAKAVADLGSAGLEVLVTVSLFAVAYEVGYITFRFGAIFIEPLLKRLFGWTNYNDFIAAEKTSNTANDKLDMLSREYSYARTQISLFITIAVLTAISKHCWLSIFSILCVILFICSAGRHMKKIQTAVAEFNTTRS